MSVTTKLGDNFLHIPKLDVASTNWVVYKDCFLWALDAHSLLDHVDGSAREPEDPIDQMITQVLMKDQLVEEKEWKTSLKTWKQEKAIVK